ncbi:MAG: 4-hydroxythreonine-4-phosphate dehydrogenase PdxA [Planctomycetota bacterium]
MSNSAFSLPRIAVSAGDPAGIGPEVVAAALHTPEVRRAARWTVYGSHEMLCRAAESRGLTPDWWRAPPGAPLEHTEGRDVVVVDQPHPDIRTGQDSAATGEAGFRAVESAIAAARDAQAPAAAVVTAPISKNAWHLAGRRSFPGHTELLASRFRAKRTVMAFESPVMRVALATSHLPLMELRNALTIGRVFDTIDLAHGFCRALGVREPRVAVCGLNPHAGEQGLLGDEDQRLIAPAIRAAVEQGISASGPFPADTVFRAARLDGRPSFDIVVAMYHDQGLIPVKLLAFESAVNVTLGLGVWRTSPDHGTAYDIAGRGRADPSSMIAAMRLAAKLAGTPSPT